MFICQSAALLRARLLRLFGQPSRGAGLRADNGHCKPCHQSEEAGGFKVYSTERLSLLQLPQVMLLWLVLFRSGAAAVAVSSDVAVFIDATSDEAAIFAKAVAIVIVVVPATAVVAAVSGAAATAAAYCAVAFLQPATIPSFQVRPPGWCLRQPDLRLHEGDHPQGAEGEEQDIRRVLHRLRGGGKEVHKGKGNK